MLWDAAYQPLASPCLFGAVACLSIGVFGPGIRGELLNQSAARETGHIQILFR